VADFATPPAKGDEVLTATTAYKISDIERDDSGGMYMLCRFDRALDG
jgi:ABC-type transporter Mla MlaB component